MILFYYILASITVENFAVNLIVIPLGMTCFVLLLHLRSFLCHWFFCMLTTILYGFIYLALFDIFMFLHLQIYKFSSVLEIFSAITSLNIGSLSFPITPSHFILHITYPLIHLPL